MKNKIIRFVSCVIACALIIVGFTFAPDTVTMVADAKKITESDIKAARDKITANKNKIKEYEANLAALEGDIEEALEEKEKLDQQMQYTSETLAELEELVADYEALIAEKEATIAVKQSEINQKTDAFKDLLRASYENGKQTYIELFVSSESLIEFLTRSDNLGSMLSYQQSLVEELDSEVAALSAMKTDLEEKKAEYSATLEEVKETEAELEKQVAAQEKFVARLQENEAEALAAKEKAEANSSELEDNLESLLSKYQKQLEEEANQALLWPLPSDVRTVTSKFGWRMLYGVKDYHLGIDIGAKTGVAVYAAADGEVVKSTYSSSYGNYILIDHGNGRATLYAHLSARLVKTGDKVTRGQTIGKVGCTGNAYGSHLHFEVRKNGKVTDPLVSGTLVIERNGEYVDVMTTGALKYSL